MAVAETVAYCVAGRIVAKLAQLGQAGIDYA
jgi:hypothetical protein